MEKQNRFVIISTVYNKSKWIEYNVNSVKQQNYSNWIALYGYDHSTDDTYDHLMKSTHIQEQCFVYNNPNPGCFLNCFM
jgi:glycosyltransferase involved in cell wall biosynthesis